MPACSAEAAPDSGFPLRKSRTEPSGRESQRQKAAVTLCNGAADALISTVPLSSLTGAVGRPTSYSVTVYQLEVCSPAVLDAH